ncbi:MAG: hypothetical protein DRR16_28175 [Candidatus Parabeggiatoa sp. nov. 3]|nr:MAG: hypothetical protein DRR00_26330 [Gammaproteobacteria bacterium]RKZ59782.1 MAG: hypothetical protein DRQ99_23160 [Gammaproteobacteria bacterium]RKZ78181.1 MAG: hypothetical protein DRR16_28175 [Gammaproteobacteria bacterium]
MNELIQKMLKIEKYLVRQKGDFQLFALFLREGSPGKWDVLVSAKWIDADKQQALKIITEQLTTQLNKDELISLSRVVVINKDNEEIPAINQLISEKNQVTEIYEKHFFGLDIKQAFLIPSSRKKSRHKMSQRNERKS